VKGRMKRFLFVTDDEGKQALSIIRAVIGLGATLLAGAMLTWFTWVTTQAYDVATNKALIRDTGIRLEKSIRNNGDDIMINSGEMDDRFDRVGAQFDRINGILHGRITKVDDKYDTKMTDLQKMLLQTNRLIVDMLIQKNKEVDLKKEEVQIQQRALDNGHDK
jgi:hypothetical protein